MMLTDKDIEKFRNIYLKHLKQDLSYEDAKNKAERLLSFMKIVYRPIRKKEMKDLIQYENKVNKR